jgi:hypothetical protein
LLAACPSARDAWERHCARWGDEPAGAYNDIAVFAHYAVALREANRIEELRSFLRSVEDLFVEGLTPAAHQVMTIGLIEDIQNITSHAHVSVNSSDFTDYLGPRTYLEWLQVHAMWGSTDT